MHMVGRNILEMKYMLRMGILCCALFVPFLVHGAPEYSVSPLIIEEELQPRDVFTTSITLTNTGIQPVGLFGMVNNVNVGEDGGIEEYVIPIEDDRSSSLASWLEFTRSRTLLAPGESAEIPLTIRVNLTAGPGVYHARIVFAPGKNSVEAKRYADTHSVPGVVITVRIEEKKNEQLRLSGFTVDRVVTGGETDTISYTVRNPGDTEIVPGGDIIFYNNRGNEVASMPVNPNGERLAPGEIKIFTDAVPSSGLLGKYKAFLTIEYGNAQIASVNDTAYFYAVSWVQLVVAFVILLILILGVSLYVHKRASRFEEEDDAEDVPLAIRDGVQIKKHKKSPLDINLKR